MYPAGTASEPPPPYSAQPEEITDFGVKTGAQPETGPPSLCTPFSSSSTTGAAISVVHPQQSWSPANASAQDDPGVNPATGTIPSTGNYVVRKASTAEPHEQFCPKCQCRIRTRQSYVTGRLTWFLVVIILIVFFPLAFLPFLIDSCKDVHHRCPKCSMLLAVKKRFFL